MKYLLLAGCATGPQKCPCGNLPPNHGAETHLKKWAPPAKKKFD